MDPVSLVFNELNRNRIKFTMLVRQKAGSAHTPVWEAKLVMFKGDGIQEGPLGEGNTKNDARRNAAQKLLDKKSEYLDFSTSEGIQYDNEKTEEILQPHIPSLIPVITEIPKGFVPKKIEGSNLLETLQTLSIFRPCLFVDMETIIETDLEPYNPDVYIRFLVGTRENPLSNKIFQNDPFNSFLGFNPEKKITVDFTSIRVIIPEEFKTETTLYYISLVISAFHSQPEKGMGIMILTRNKSLRYLKDFLMEVPKV